MSVSLSVQCWYCLNEETSLHVIKLYQTNCETNFALSTTNAEARSVCGRKPAYFLDYDYLLETAKCHLIH